MKTPKFIVPQEIHCGVFCANNFPYPQAIVVPYNDKSKTIVDNFCNYKRRWPSYRKVKTDFEDVVIPNKLLTGFKILNNNTQSGAKVLDPRGFVVDINNENLLYIITNCVVHDGIILSPCLWVQKSHSNTYLLPKDTPYYHAAIRLTDIRSTSIKANEVAVGNRVALQNGLEGIYLGKYYPLSFGFVRGYFNTNTTGNTVLSQGWFLPRTKKHYFYDDAKQIIIEMTSPKFSRINDDSTMNQQEVDKIISKYSYYNVHGAPLKHEALLNTRPKKLKYSLKKVDDFDSSENFYVCLSNNNYYVAVPGYAKSRAFYEANLGHYYSRGIIRYAITGNSVNNLVSMRYQQGKVEIFKLAVEYVT